MIEDFIIGNKWSNEIEKIFLDREFPWYYIDTITSEKEEAKIFGFYHGIYSDGRIISNTYNFVLPILYQFCDKHEIQMNQLLRIRAGLLTKSNDSNHHEPHIDFQCEHKTLLYYVNESDGETYFFNNNIVTKKIEPKKGKCVLFDGKIYHASSSPTKNNRRIVINYNFV